MAIPTETPKQGHRMQVRSAEIEILSQYLASLRAVNRCTVAAAINAIHLAATDHGEFITL